MSTSSSDADLKESRFMREVKVISPLTEREREYEYFFSLKDATGSKLRFNARGNAAIRLSVRVGMQLEVMYYILRWNPEFREMEAYLETESELHEIRRHIL
ncbi:hypothetical protein TKK_0014619 [Trichogramma kaykai]